MNRDPRIQQAREIPVQQIWNRLALGPVNASGMANAAGLGRVENTPSVQVGGKKNIVTDYGGKTYDSIALVQHVKGCTFNEALDYLVGPANDQPKRNDNSNTHHRPQRQIKTTYPYHDGDGTLLYEVVRFDPKDFSQRRPDGNGGFVYNLNGTRRILYRLPALLKAISEGQQVYAVEGEKDVQNLCEIGLAATCNPGGAGKWKPEYSESLRGARVCILPDNDEPGRNHAETVAQSLQGVASEVKVLELPRLPPKGDVSDWLQQGHTREDLEALVELCPVWNPPFEERNLEPDYNPEEQSAASLTPPLTDIGNAERFVRDYRGKVRFVPSADRFLIFDTTRWKWDELREVEVLAKKTVRGILEEAKGISDSDVFKRRLAWVRTSESDSRIRALLNRVKPEVALRADDLDPDPWVLNCLNGTLDLRTGELKSHRPEDYCTKIIPAKYTPEAKCPVWTEALKTWTNGDSDLISYLQRSVGYSLTGNTREEVFFFLHGAGSNGKSKFTEAIQFVGGDYSQHCEFSTFLESHSDRIRTDIAKLRGARLVTASEPKPSRGFDESLLKALTGDELVTARFLFHDEFTYQKEFKLWLSANHRPVIRDMSLGFWRRLHLVPFEVTIPPEKRDLDIALKLRDEAPGILSWAVQGCLEWQGKGLNPPDRVLSAVRQYREESDSFADFVADCCVLFREAKVTTSRLRDAYLTWVESNDREALGPKAMANRLSSEFGCRSGKVGEQRGWHGIGIRETGQPDTSDTSDGYSERFP